MSEEKLNAGQKALQINLDARKYGTFAEIGAGQETARWFFRVGGASGTVAKTISAYDMTISDAIYGSAERYVSRKRLRAMLDYEWDLLLERLEKPRGEKSTFFAFANTVATRRFACTDKEKEEGHGWLGVKFQTQPHEGASQIIIHVRMLDAENARAQEALGIIGVNLLYGAFYLYGSPAVLVASLMDDLTRERIEVDMIKFSGPRFADVDNRLMALQLVSQELTEAAMFTAAGESIIPGEVLYKKPVLVERGSFRPLTNVTLDVLERGLEQFRCEPQLQGEEPVVLLEMTLRQLLVDEKMDHRDFLDRVDTLSALGKTVLISSFRRYHRLVEYLSRQTQKMIGLPLGVTRLRDVLDEKFYTDLPGGLLESLGTLFKNSAKLYVYPAIDRATGKVITLENLEVPPKLRHLYAHLRENGYVEDIRKYNPEHLTNYSADVLAKIKAKDASWEKHVPQAIAKVIKEKKLFGYG